MKKQVILSCIACVVFLLFCSTTVFATIDSIYEYLQRVDKNYKIVLGANASGGYSFAAIDVAIGVKKYNTRSPDLEPVIESKAIAHESKIIIGHPCENSLIPIPCDSWPYRKGEAVIRVQGNDLIIAGSSLEDTRRAAKVIGNYKAYPLLKETQSIVVTGKGLEEFNISKQKTVAEMICGDNVCDHGEICFTDCAKMTCFDACEDEGFAEAACRDAKSNPNVPSCLPEEQSKGAGYCATGKVCCCKKTTQVFKEKTTEEKQEPSLPQEKKSFWQKIVLLIKKLFTFGGENG